MKEERTTQTTPEKSPNTMNFSGYTIMAKIESYVEAYVVTGDQELAEIAMKENFMLDEEKNEIDVLEESIIIEDAEGTCVSLYLRHRIKVNNRRKKRNVKKHSKNGRK
jgi:hypothetical protein